LIDLAAFGGAVRVICSVLGLLVAMSSETVAVELTEKQIVGCWGYNNSTKEWLDSLTFCFHEDHTAWYGVTDAHDGWDGSVTWSIKPGGVLAIGKDDCQFMPDTTAATFAFRNCFGGKKFQHRCSKLDETGTTCAK
jgi:hypothetical protein